MMRPKAYEIMCRCIEEGVAEGWQHAHKYTDTPLEQEIRDEIEQAVRGQFCEWFDFVREVAE